MVNKKLKLIIFLALTIILICFVLFLISLNNKKDYINFKKIPLSNFTKKYVENGGDNVEFLDKIENNTIYGSITDTLKNGNLFFTKGLYTYNISNNKFKYYENKEKNRIIDFYIRNNILYKVVLENTNNLKSDRYYWKVVSCNLSTKKETKLLDGYIINIFNFPRLLFDKDNIYLVTINNGEDLAEKEDYSLYKIFENYSEKIFSYSGYQIKNEGIIAHNITYNKVYNNYFYYTVIDERPVQYLMKINLKNLEKTKIRETSNKNRVINNYIPTKNGLYINFIDKETDTNSYIEYYYNGKVSKLKMEMNTFEHVINEDHLLFHNMGNKFILYNFKKNKVIPLTTSFGKNINLYPGYLVIKDNLIMVEDYDGNFYVDKINYNRK